MERIHARGMFLFEGERKFVVRGVSYGPFRANPLGEPFPEKGGFARDCALLQELGANTLRIYHPPPTWFAEQADEAGLRLLVGVPWSWHLRSLDTRRQRADIRQVVREAAETLRSVPNALGLLIGNELPPQIARWYGARRVQRFLTELVDEARQANPEILISYANFPPTEYLELDGLDFVSFNVYLHHPEAFRAYIARLQNLTGFRPLVLTEFGVDSIREGEAAQAQIVSHSAATAIEMGCAGTVVFSFTDEWHTGGSEIEDWAFGVTTGDRTPKPAFEAVKQVYRSEHPSALAAAPRVSVVVCAFNAERTMSECLESLRRLRYPDFEVIVVNDGSTDGTKAIAERYPEFRLISDRNRGLSAARNAGILAASGEIVAFTDSDCAVDPDWLTFLVSRLLVDDYAGVGGPNLPPPEEHWIPEAVARCPGGPTHVLLSDREAEHIPGCNMAFWRRTLIELGLFDPTFHAAGDDVDICWRLQDAGHSVGYSACALVWHRRRATARAYLRQQRGYGRAEALLYLKHPFRFNWLGGSQWMGRIYADLGAGIFRRRPAIYGGPFGSGLFQTLYEPPSSLMRHLPVTLEWNLTAFTLAAGGAAAHAAGMSAAPLWIAGLALFAVSVLQAVSSAVAVEINGLPPVRSRSLIALLSYLGPLLRALERVRGRLGRLTTGSRTAEREPPRHASVDWLRRRLVLSYWNETGIEQQTCISALLDLLQRRKFPVVLDDGWQPWDLSVHLGPWTRARLKILVQSYEGARYQVDAGFDLRQGRLGKLIKAAAAVTLTAGLVAGVAPLTLLGGAALLWIEVFLLYETYRLAEALQHHIDVAFESLPLEPIPIGTSAEVTGQVQPPS